MFTEPDWDDWDGPPVFCPKCEARGILSEIKQENGYESYCPEEDCDYIWSCADDGAMGDRERL